jgi:hypothetical protein
MKTCIIESPYAGDLVRNAFYLQRAIRHCIFELNLSPYASHQMLTTALDDNSFHEREIGIYAGLRWAHYADRRIFFLDYGMSRGMQAAEKYYTFHNLPYEYVRIGENPRAPTP